MNWFEEVGRIVLGLTITGLVSAIVWLLKWHSLVDLKIHDIGRDIKHLQRTQAQLSTTVAHLDSEDEKITTTFRKDLTSIDRRMGRVETRIYVIEVIVKPPTTQA